ncbi:MAG TPA: BRCT domain-containing protein [Frankiaceae bacterium]|nr:BRCT domain-containing protein [Frankiaceae bacterium]
MALPFANLTVVVTGEVPGMDRDGARAAVRLLGGTAAAGVTRSVDLLVVGEGAGVAKLRKAGELEIRQLTAKAFAALVREPESWDGNPLGSVASPPVEPSAPAERATGGHGAGSSSWMRAGRYVTVVNCRCGWRHEADRYNDARSAHSDHRRAVGDPDLANEETAA